MESKQSSTSGLIYLSIVYVVWGSTYLAIRVAVRDGSGFSPFMMAGMRTLAAGSIMMAWAVLAKQRIKPSRGELLTLALAAMLLWVGGNGLVSWGEQRADSGIAAMIIASVPVWAAAIGAIWDRKLPSLLVTASLLIGSAGIVVLSMPSLRSGARSDVLSVLAIVAASLSWALGTVIQSKRRVAISPIASAGFQMLIGSAGFFLVALIIREPAPHPVMDAWLAWGYLVIFGSVVAFTSYVRALQMLPTNIVTTYAFVNPIIAIFLGWLILSEPVTGWTVAGAALVLLGVTGVFLANMQAQKRRRRAVTADAAEVADPAD